MAGYVGSTDNPQEANNAGAAGAAAAGTAAGANPLAETAFRRAEKKYQLHYEQQLRHRKGRLRGGKLVEQPTDFSDVIDIRQPAAACGAATAVVLQRPEQRPGSTCSCVDDTITALVFRAHPGLVVFPAAVPAELQLQLMHAALEQWPDPPARTNHTKAYGTSLCGLFQAAQQGLSLATAEQQQQQQQQPAAQQPDRQQQAAQQLNTPGAAEYHHPQQQQPGTSHACQQGQQHPHPGPNCRQGQQQGQQDPQEAIQCCQQFQPQLQHLPNGSGGPWLLGGTGPKASTLLRKLHWVCLGPPYNWTDRVYEPHLPHMPLPSSLVQLAQQHAQLAHQALLQADATGAGGALPAAATQQAACLTAAPAAATEGAAAAPAVAADAAGSSGRAAAAVSSCCYLPDAALVNYYHSGDTLNGHKDDVEKDLGQPIVTVSLGCEAVFLVGGATRDVEPTALLLRSGDVVVMGQEARACYHGVPRVLTDRPLPPELLLAAEQAPPTQQQCLQHMQGCRINISIRTTA